MEKKYTTEEERKEARKEYLKQYLKQYRQDNKEKIAEYSKQWREKNAEYYKQYRQDNKEKIAEYDKQYYTENREKHIGLIKQYRQTPMGRALYLVNNYKRIDKEMDRGECTLTAQWIIDNIFSQKCIYCGESDWRKLGCDRIDNEKSHTEDNVVPCCGDCNNKRQKKPFEEFLAEYKKDLEDIATT